MLNRFSKDIGLMDDLLPDTFYDYCRVGYVCLVLLLYLADNTRVSLLKTITFYLLTVLRSTRKVVYQYNILNFQKK